MCHTGAFRHLCFLVRFGMEEAVTREMDLGVKDREAKERQIYRMCAVALMLAGWSIGIINLMGWARF
jgi:hypothetical protein